MSVHLLLFYVIDLSLRLQEHSAIVQEYKNKRAKVFRVWYCASAANVDNIVARGFNKSGEIEDKGGFGQGTYFATSPK